MKKIRKKVTKVAVKNFWDEVQKISTVGFACTSKIFIEKLLWITLGVIGLVWISFVLTVQFQDWEENAGVLTKRNFDLKYPAITICPKVSTKYAIVERLGNYIDPLNLPEKLLSLKEDVFLCATYLPEG